MAEINTDSGGGHGKHGGKKGRKKGGSPRVDMTPMVDLAFLLLTFFVLTSQLNKMKTMELTEPKDIKDTANTTKINYKLANTILLDGNKDDKVYYYPGKFDPDTTHIIESSFDPKAGIREYAMLKNSKIVEDVRALREQYRKDDKMTEEQFKDQYNKIIEKDSTGAPFFIVKWGGDAKYGEVVHILDELKIADIRSYALTPITQAELLLLSKKTGRHYKELDTMPAQTAAPASN